MYYVRFKGLRGVVRRERATKPEALALVDYLQSHGISSKMGLIRKDGSLGLPQVKT